MRRPVLVLLLWLLLLPGALAAAPRIGLVTMQPGEEYWSRFGHNAILVEYEDGERWLFNYGFFDFDQPGFLARFLRGKMLYRLAKVPYEDDLAYYAAEGRGVDLQWLRFTSDEASRLASFLEWNALPENAEYRYDYFLDNCATRVRDALDQALGGVLRPQLIGRSRGLSFRSESLRLAADEGWLWLGIHAGLGPAADRSLARWDEAFVPMRLAESLQKVRTPSGEPLVVSEHPLLPHRLSPAHEDPPRRSGGFALVGLALALGLAGLGSRNRSHVLAAGLLSVFWLGCALGGLLLLGLWLGTDHVAAHANINLLLLSPLALPLLAWLPGLARRRQPSRFAVWLATLVALLAVLVPLGAALRLVEQDATDFVLLLAPAHVALALRLHRLRVSRP